MEGDVASSNGEFVSCFFFHYRIHVSIDDLYKSILLNYTSSEAFTFLLCVHIYATLYHNKLSEMCYQTPANGVNIARIDQWPDLIKMGVVSICEGRVIDSPLTPAGMAACGGHCDLMLHLSRLLYHILLNNTSSVTKRMCWKYERCVSVTQ